MKFTHMAVGALLIVSLSACGSSDNEEQLTADDLNPSAIKAGMSCDRSQFVTAELNRRIGEDNNADIGPGQANELIELGLDPADDKQVKKVRTALDAACDSQPEPTPAASDDPVEPQADEPTETASPTETPGMADETESNKRLKFKTWTQVVNNRPEDLRTRINTAAEQSGFGFPTVRQWARDYENIDARALLVFGYGDDGLTSDELRLARDKAGVGVGTPVIRVTACTYLDRSDDCPTSGGRIILAPINIVVENNEEEEVLGWGHGLVMRTDMPLIEYKGVLVANTPGT